MKTYDLRKGLGTYDTYIASRYPGGELYFNFLTQLGDHDPVVNFLTRLTSSDDLVLLCWEEEKGQNLLQQVFLDGKITYETNLGAIRGLIDFHLNGGTV